MTFLCHVDFQLEGGLRLRRRFENPRVVLQARHLDEIGPLLRQIETYAKQGCWAVGMVAYEASAAFDPAFKTFSLPSGLPLTAFAVFDNEHAGDNNNSVGTFTCSPWRNDTSRADFERIVERIREDIAAGDYYQTNYTTRLTADFNGSPEAFFHALCEAQPGGYSLFLDFGDWQIASVSPEMFFAWNSQTGALTTRPMKGTAAANAAAEDLRASIKDRAENLMIVDLMRNDISRIAHTVRVPELFAVQTLPTALQMTSTITGTTHSGISLSDVFAALFPCGSITGAPKIAAMEAIAEYETSPRGAYCGALGVIRPGGEAMFSVGIRSVTLMGGKATCGVGCGMTWDSKPAEEYAESQIKQRFLWRASAPFDLLETMRLENGEYWLLSRHMERLARSASFFGFVYDESSIEQALQNLAQNNPQGLQRVRLMVTRHGDVKTEVHPFELAPAPAQVAIASHPIHSDDEFLRHKTTHRAAYAPFAARDPAVFDTLFFNERDEITEFTRGNVAVELDGKLITPPENCGLLPGVLRAELLAKDTLHERIIKREDLSRVTGLWFLNSLRGMIPVQLALSTSRFRMDLADETHGKKAASSF